MHKADQWSLRRGHDVLLSIVESSPGHAPSLLRSHTGSKAGSEKRVTVIRRGLSRWRLPRLIASRHQTAPSATFAKRRPEPTEVSETWLVAPSRLCRVESLLVSPANVSHRGTKQKNIMRSILFAAVGGLWREGGARAVYQHGKCAAQGDGYQDAVRNLELRRTSRIV